MQERRLKRLGLLDDDGKSTYDGAQRHTHNAMLFKSCAEARVPACAFVFLQCCSWQMAEALCFVCRLLQGRDSLSPRSSFWANNGPILSSAERCVYSVRG